MQVPAVQDAVHQASLLGIRLEGWLTLVAVILGPILAVQAQKAIEQRREQRLRKLLLFRELMATRGTRLSARHVEALNTIEMEFAGNNPKQRAVYEAWRIYFDALGEGTDQMDDAVRRAFYDRRDDMFVNLLYELGKFNGLAFDKVAIKRNIYTPTGHAVLEQDLFEIRKSLMEILSGKRAMYVWALRPPDAPPLPVNIVNTPRRDGPPPPEPPRMAPEHPSPAPPVAFPLPGDQK